MPAVALHTLQRAELALGALRASADVVASTIERGLAADERQLALAVLGSTQVMADVITQCMTDPLASSGSDFMDLLDRALDASKRIEEVFQ